LNWRKFFEALREVTKEAIGTGRGPDAIEVPEFYGAGDKGAWVRKATLEHWHKFYEHATERRL